jgi:hypothetical protein
LDDILELLTAELHVVGGHVTSQVFMATLRSGDSSTQSKKKHSHHDGDGGPSRKRRKRDKLKIVDDDPNDDMWVEKNIDMDGEQVGGLNFLI